MANKPRDEFTQPTIEKLARRVGYRCSNPNCRQLTSGPKQATDGFVNVGHAAHITAAASEDLRYDETLTRQQRRSFDNGIWLCAKCAALIDRDVTRYTVELLRNWKRVSEEAAQLEVEGTLPYTNAVREQDRDLLRFYSQCLDRPAFQDVFLREHEQLPNFDKAIEDTITAINTGCLVRRDGVVLAQAKGKSYLANQEWREKMDLIVVMLRTIRERYRTLPLTDGYEDFQNLGRWMDATREQIITTFNDIGSDAGLAPLPSPQQYWKLHQG